MSPGAASGAAGAGVFRDETAADGAGVAPWASAARACPWSAAADAAVGAVTGRFEVWTLRAAIWVTPGSVSFRHDRQNFTVPVATRGPEDG
jgi:hypothetical protein